MTTATQHLADVKQYIDRPTLTDALVISELAGQGWDEAVIIGGR